jgi:hypothetical protein
METAAVAITARAFADALQRILSSRGYLSERSFDLQLDVAGAACDWIVLQVFRAPPASGWAGSASVRAQSEGAAVTLMLAEGDQDLAAQFASMVVEAAGAAGTARRSGSRRQRPQRHRDSAL